MAKQVMVPAQLDVRDSDVSLTDEQFMKLSLFAQLKRKPSLDKYPGSVVLRRYRKNEMICRQGEPGWTAFYLLTSEDVLALREEQLRTAEGVKRRNVLEEEIAALRSRVQLIQTGQRDDLREAAMVYLAVAKTARHPGSSLAQLARNLGRNLGSGPVKNVDQQTLYIPVDGPVTVNYDSLRAPLREGELFGEMSCMYRSPRSATIVARRDCYMVEMLRNILDQIQKDADYKKKADAVYKERIFALHLRKLSVFSDLTEAEFKEVRDSAELISVEPGTLICDEHDRSDCMYIVRGGLVKVMKNVSALLDPDDIPDWKALCAALKEGKARPDMPAGKVWQLLPERARTILDTAPDSARFNLPDRNEVLYALNDVIKKPALVDAKEFQPLLAPGILPEASRAMLEKRQELKKKKQEWPDAETRRFNRWLLEAALPKVLRPLAGHAGPETILSYCSRGDFFGEIGLMLGRPRGATCVAFGHPNDLGVVELVRLPGQAFWKLMKNSASVKAKVQKEVERRRQETMKRLMEPVWDDTQAVQFSEQFEELGLIQGQQLMLIDLDRCTRCDECVRGCVNTHDDGRTRLFLDGPRFGKYLVPTTCRSCLDPVCMIGCPVGSIHRGDNREIVIEDWCIGCSLCADSCPYGSILMHDLGIIPEKARGWRFLPATKVGNEKWLRPSFRDADWLPGEAPFRLDRDFVEQLTFCKAPSSATVNFRREFQLTKTMLKEAAGFKLEVVSQSPAVKVWVNGQAVEPDDKPRRGRYEFTLPQKSGGGESKPVPLYAGANALAVQVTSNVPAGEVLMQARLDEIRRPDLPGSVEESIAAEVTQKLVTQRAVVCDLCSTLPGKVPACVNACPHDAAMRVNARFNFPVR
jgi:Fe-S-cluster-containing hydrogenase component 2/CRP-like cAMP-binding protein